MRRFHVEVYVRIRKDLLEPQGATIEKAMKRLGITGVKNTRVGKLIEFDLEEESEERACQIVEDISRKLLSNPVIEEYTYTIKEI